MGIWYNKIPVQTVVWVANRDHPISGTWGVLNIGNDGNLVVLDGNSTIVWSTNSSSVSTNSTATLMDNGNLVLTRSEDTGDSSRALWQSFNNPTDTYIPEMRAYMIPIQVRAIFSLHGRVLLTLHMEPTHGVLILEDHHRY